MKNLQILFHSVEIMQLGVTPESGFERMHILFSVVIQSITSQVVNSMDLSQSNTLIVDSKLQNWCKALA